MENNDNISEKVEKQELEKKYYSQKKQIKTKLEDANKALNENIKEVEEDFEKILIEEPTLLSEDDKVGFKNVIKDQFGTAEVVNSLRHIFFIISI